MGQLWRFCWRGVFAYRAWDETYRGELWKIKPEGIGWTFLVENSSWLRDLLEDEVFSGLHHDSLHFVISTQDDVIEVIAPDHPKVDSSPSN